MTQTAEQAEIPFESAPDTRLGTYFVVGITTDNQPALYLTPHVPGFSRDRDPDMHEVRRIVDSVAEELRLRTIASSVAAALAPPPPPPTPGERVAQAMAERQDTED